MRTPISLNDMRDMTAQATDGPIGKVKDFYFDDRTWKIRYAVVHAGKLPRARDVLILPQLIEKPGRWTSTLRLNVTREQVEKSPDVDTDMPVSRQHEYSLMRHYNADVFFSWTEGYVGSHNFDLSGVDLSGTPRNKDGKDFDPHLYSFKSVAGMHVSAVDGGGGHVRDFIVDDEAWTIQFLLIETGSVFDTKMVLVSPLADGKIRISESIVHVDMPRIKIQESPEYDPLASDLDEMGETGLYGRRKFNEP